MTGLIGFCCGQCGGDRFPTGMRVVLCPVCQEKIHAGCWSTHENGHRQGDPTADPAQGMRRGVVGEYGVIRWSEESKT